MRDASPWDNLDYAGKHLTPVKGTIEIDVNELTNTGQVVAEFVEDADRYRIVFDRFAAAKPYQDGGIATRVYEHGNSGNGDPYYPKMWLYLAGWGTGTVLPRIPHRMKPSFICTGPKSLGGSPGTPMHQGEYIRKKGSTGNPGVFTTRVCAAAGMAGGFKPAKLLGVAGRG